MRQLHLSAALLAASALAGCGGGGDAPSDNPFAARPSYLRGEPSPTRYDGVTAGLQTGLAPDLASLLAYTAPAGDDPSPAVLRTRQIQASG